MWRVGKCTAGRSFAFIIIGYILNWDLQCASTLDFAQDLPEVVNFIIVSIQWGRVLTVRYIKHNWFKSHGDSWALSHTLERWQKNSHLIKWGACKLSLLYVNEDGMPLQLSIGCVCVCVCEFVCTDYYYHHQKYTANVKTNDKNIRLKLAVSASNRSTNITSRERK